MELFLWQYTDPMTARLIVDGVIVGSSLSAILTLMYGIKYIIFNQE